jgi:hypothetical protein
MFKPNFASILDESPTEVKSPPPMPVGTYICIVKGQPRYDKSAKKQTDFVEFTLRPMQPLSDVDEDDLAAAGGLEGKTIRATYYLTEDAVFMLDKFHADCGIDLNDGKSRRHRNDSVVNSEVVATIKHRISDKDSTRVFAELGYTANVDTIKD